MSGGWLGRLLGRLHIVRALRENGHARKRLQKCLHAGSGDGPVATILTLGQAFEKQGRDIRHGRCDSGR